MDPAARASLPRTFAVVYAGVLVVSLIVAWNTFFGDPIAEYGDLAANSLQVDRAKDFAEIYGNYSRFGFHHPGPAFFYVYALGEILFYDLLGITPAEHNAHLLAGALLQGAFLALAISVLACYAGRGRWPFAAAATVIALIHFNEAGHPDFSVWPPEALVLPFACFLVLCIALASGWTALLPLVAIAGSFLVHGHVAQPLFVLVLAAAAYVVAVRREGRGPLEFVRRYARLHAITAVALAVFLLPLAIDATDRGQSNLAEILRNVVAEREPEDSHALGEVVAYMLAYLGYPAEAVLDFGEASFVDFVAEQWTAFIVTGAILATGLVALAFAGRRRHRDAESAADFRLLASYYGFLVLALVLGLIWVIIQRGPLFQFNSFFFYGLIFVAFLPGLLYAARCLHADERATATAAAGIAAVGLAAAVSFDSPVPSAEDPVGADLAAATEQLLQRGGEPEEGIRLDYSGVAWPLAASVALELEREGVEWFVPFNWELQFGSDHLYVSGQAPEADDAQRWLIKTPEEGSDPQDPDEVTIGERAVIDPTPGAERAGP